MSEAEAVAALAADGKLIKRPLLISEDQVLVGFDVTPEMAAFNREGKRFRLNAGSDTAARP